MGNWIQNSTNIEEYGLTKLFKFSNLVEVIQINNILT